MSVEICLCMSVWVTACLSACIWKCVLAFAGVRVCMCVCVCARADVCAVGYLCVCICMCRCERVELELRSQNTNNYEELSNAVLCHVKAAWFNDYFIGLLWVTVLVLIHKLIQNIIKAAPEMCACIMFFKADTSQWHQTMQPVEMSNSQSFLSGPVLKC